MATTAHFWASLREGWSEVRSRSWVMAFLSGMASTTSSCCRRSSSSARSSPRRDERRESWAIITAGFGVGCVLGDLLFLRWRPRFALRIASLMLIGASFQAAFIGSGFSDWGDRRARGARRRLRHRHVHAVGDLAAGAHPRPRIVPGVQLRLPDQRGPDPARQPVDRSRQRHRRRTRFAVRDDGAGRHRSAVVASLPAVRRLPRGSTVAEAAPG